MHIVIITFYSMSFRFHTLSSSRRRPCKHAKKHLCRRSESVLTCIPIFASFAGWLVNTPHVARCCCGWRVYTQSFLGVHGVTVGWLRTNGTANNERVHSICWFLPNPFIEDLFFWRSSQGFVKTDLYPLSRGLLISVQYAVCSTRRWSMCRPLFGACQWSNFAEERRP